MSWPFIKNNLPDPFIISLFLAVLLLGTAIPVFGAEMVLNSAVSVAVPDRQSGNPGEFLTFMLELSNRGSKPLTLQVEYLSEHRWSAVGDVTVNLPGHTSKAYFPVTVMIPQNAPAGFEEKLRVRFKVAGEAFPLPDVVLTARVNAVSAIHFNIPPSAKGSPGSTVTYPITVTNTGNTDEQFTVRYRSSNSWPVQVEPAEFALAAGESRTVRVQLQIPGLATLPSDQLELTFRWGREQKVVNLTTFIVDRLDSLSAQYYIWQGYFNLSQPNLYDLKVGETHAELALNGQWGPDQSVSLYAADQGWFTNFHLKTWDLKTGQFPLTWPGLVTPATGQANLWLSNTAGDRQLAISSWDSATAPGQTVWGVDASLNERSQLRFLHDPLPGEAQNLLEWHYQQNLTPGTFWTNALSADLRDPSRYAGAAGLAGQLERWQWNTHLKYLRNLNDALQQKSLWATLGTPPLTDGTGGYLQLQYESKQLDEGSSGVNDYDDLQLKATATLPAGLLLNLSRSLHWSNASLAGSNSTLGWGWSRQAGRFRHESSFSYSVDQDAVEGRSTYHSFDWYTRYALSASDGLILNPNFDSDFSRLGFGYQRRWPAGPELTTLLYSYWQSHPKYNWTVDLTWPIYQYWLAFKYSGLWESGSYSTDYASLSIYKRFSFPVQKPLGGIAGVAFVDRNRNGVRDAGEPAVGNLDLLLDGKTSVATDSEGRILLSGLSPGEHSLALDPRYNVIYLSARATGQFSVKPYQTAAWDLPLIRTRNITGLVYAAGNSGPQQGPARPGIAGVPVLLTDLATGATRRTYSDGDGYFVFYQLAPDPYQVTIEAAGLPEGWQLPPDFQPVPVAAADLTEQPELRIGLIPHEKPIEIITLPAGIISLAAAGELVNRGASLPITVSVAQPVKNAALLLPDGSRVRLASSRSRWKYTWKVPKSLPPGPYVIRCEIETRAGERLRAETEVIIL
jgi:hypothetical protein